jgi:hypothetical protein
VRTTEQRSTSGDRSSESQVEVKTQRQ